MRVAAELTSAGGGEGTVGVSSEATPEEPETGAGAWRARPTRGADSIVGKCEDKEKQEQAKP